MCNKINITANGVLGLMEKDKINSSVAHEKLRHKSLFARYNKEIKKAISTADYFDHMEILCSLIEERILLEIKEHTKAEGHSHYDPRNS